MSGARGGVGTRVPGAGPTGRGQSDSDPHPGRYRLRETVRCEDGLLVATRPLVVTRLNDAATRVVETLSTESYRHPAAVAETAELERSAVATLLERLHDRGFLDWRPAGEPGYRPAVSVIVVVRDAADHLGACLDALASLEYPEYEVIVVDDGSTDDTRSVAQSHGCSTRLVEVGRPDAPIGIGASRNRGVAAADKEVVAFTDADCRPRTDWLSKLVPALAAHDVVGGRVRPAETADASAYEAINSSLDMGSRAARVRRDGATPYLPTANLLARASTVESVGFPERNVAEDVHFCWTALERGFDVVYDPRGVVDHDYGDERRFGERRRSYGASEALLATEFQPAGSVPIPVVPVVAVVLSVFVATVVLPFGLAGSVAGLPVGGVVVAAGTVWRMRRQSGGLVDLTDAFRSLGRRSLSSVYAVSRELTRYYSLPVLAVSGVVAAVRPVAGVALAVILLLAAVVPALVEYRIQRPSTGLGYARYYLRDHVAYQLGAYRGAVAHRTVRHLNPAGRFELRVGW